MTYQEVHDALFKQWPDYGQWLIDPESDYDYGEYVRSEWRGDDDLVIVEQDVVPPPDSIMGLIGCPQPWCAHEVNLGTNWSARTLSLVKLSRRLQVRWPGLAAAALPRPGSGYPPTHWRSVDQALVRALEFKGLQVHVHQPPARHLHKYTASPPAGPVPATPDKPA